MNVFNFSGGKDSTALILLAYDLGIPVDRVICADSGGEFPGIEENIYKVNKLVESKGGEFVHLRPDKTFEYWATEHKGISRKGNQFVGYGFPSRMNRFCNTKLKTAIISKIKNPPGAVTFVGITADEPERARRKYAERGSFRFLLIEKGMKEADCLQYCYARGFDFGGYYKRFRRSGCWFCPLQNNDSLYTIYKEFPELWARIVAMQKRIKENNKLNPEASPTTRVGVLGKENTGTIWNSGRYIRMNGVPKKFLIFFQTPIDNPAGAAIMGS